MTLVFGIRADNSGVTAWRYPPEIGRRVGITRPQPGGLKEIHLVVAACRIEHKPRLHTAPVWRIEHVPAGTEVRLDVEHSPAQPFGELRMFQHLRADHLETVGQRVVTTGKAVGDRAARNQRQECGAEARCHVCKRCEVSGAEDRPSIEASTMLSSASRSRRTQRRISGAQSCDNSILALCGQGTPSPPSRSKRPMFAQVECAALDELFTTDYRPVLTDANRRGAMATDPNTE